MDSAYPVSHTLSYPEEGQPQLIWGIKIMFPWKDEVYQVGLDFAEVDQASEPYFGFELPGKNF